MQKQLNHEEFKLIQKQNKINLVYVLENLEHMENIGSAFRLGDSFNIDEIVIVSESEINFNKIKKTARNCEKTVKFKIIDNIKSALDYIVNLNYKVFNLEITDKSIPLREINFSNYEKIALIVGNESHGVSDYVLNRIKESVHIDMYGNNSSMNVATSLAIATYKISEDFLKKE